MRYKLFYLVRLVFETDNLWELMERINEPNVCGPVQLHWETRTDEGGTYDVAMLRNWIVLRNQPVT
jgi:hypothetical protein